jgi:GNAT superfamily N-acetyltransferase
LLVLPSGFSARPPVPDDLDEVTKLVLAAELADLGESMVTKEDIAAAWAQPSFDLGRDATVIETGARIVAAAETFRTRAEVTIHPDMRGLGLGTWLLGWVEARGRAKGERRTRQTRLDRDAGAAAVLRQHGYEVGYVSWILEISLDEKPAEPRPPDGVVIRHFIPGQDDRDVHRVIEDAFNAWPDREPTTLEDWQAMIPRRQDFEPGLLDVAVEGDQIVGACVGLNYEGEGGWIQQLAVRASHRRRGIAGALIQTAFCTSWERGRRTCGVSTDSRTGALGLYERAGMKVTKTAKNFVKEL